MATIYIPLKDMVTDLDKKTDLSSLPREEAASLIKNSFGFLSSTVDVCRLPADRAGHGYRQREVADHLGMYFTSVSRIMKQESQMSQMTRK